MLEQMFSNIQDKYEQQINEDYLLNHNCHRLDNRGMSVAMLFKGYTLTEVFIKVAAILGRTKEASEILLIKNKHGELCRPSVSKLHKMSTQINFEDY